MSLWQSQVIGTTPLKCNQPPIKLALHRVHTWDRLCRMTERSTLIEFSQPLKSETRCTQYKKDQNIWPLRCLDLLARVRMEGLKRHPVSKQKLMPLMAELVFRIAIWR